jgi:hypothetical protein
MKKFFPLCLILVLAFSWSIIAAEKVDTPVRPSVSNVGEASQIILKWKQN